MSISEFFFIMTEGYSFLQLCMLNFLENFSFYNINLFLVFVKYSDTEYLNEAWIPINNILTQLLQNSIENFKPTSYQTIYW